MRIFTFQDLGRNFGLRSQVLNKNIYIKFPLKSTGEAWAEIVAARIGEHLGLTMGKMTVARFEGTVGVLSEKFRSIDEGFFAGGDLFLEFCPDFDRESLDHYHVDMLFRVLTK